MPNLCSGLRRTLLLLIAVFFVDGLIGLIKSAPDRTLSGIEHRRFIGQSLKTLEETLLDLGLSTSRTRYYARAGAFCHPVRDHVCLTSMEIDLFRSRGTSEVCVIECIFVYAYRLDTREAFWVPVQHRYKYVFIVENNNVVASFDATTTWEFPLYL